VTETGIPKYFTYAVSAWAGGGFFGPDGDVTVRVTLTVVVFVPPIAQPARTKATARRAATRTPETLLLPAVGTDPCDLDAVVGGDEPVALGRLVHPAVEVALFDFDDPMAALADEMVMMRLAA
jgi:hypothetical protein